jgi:hypothetical protein
MKVLSQGWTVIVVREPDEATAGREVSGEKCVV